MRRALAVAAGLFLAAVPAALAATQAVAPAEPADGQARPLSVERPLIRREAARKSRAAARAAVRKRRDALPAVGVPPQLAAIAKCESHGNPRSIGGGGSYRGKYQMTYAIWASVGGSGDPAAASEEEQDRRAALLYQRSGPGQWPVCGQ